MTLENKNKLPQKEVKLPSPYLFREQVKELVEIDFSNLSKESAEKISKELDVLIDLCRKAKEA